MKEIKRCILFFRLLLLHSDVKSWLQWPMFYKCLNKWGQEQTNLSETVLKDLEWKTISRPLISIFGFRRQTLRGLGNAWAWNACWSERDGGVIGEKGLLVYGAQASWGFVDFRCFWSMVFLEILFQRGWYPRRLYLKRYFVKFYTDAKTHRRLSTRRAGPVLRRKKFTC